MEFDHCSTRTSNRLVIVATPICSNRFLTAGVPSQQKNNALLLLRVVKDKLPAVANYFFFVIFSELLKRSHETERSRVEQKALISDPKWKDPKPKATTVAAVANQAAAAVVVAVKRNQAQAAVARAVMYQDDDCRRTKYICIGFRPKPVLLKTWCSYKLPACNLIISTYESDFWWISSA